MREKITGPVTPTSNEAKAATWNGQGTEKGRSKHEQTTSFARNQILVAITNGLGRFGDKFGGRST